MDNISVLLQLINKLTWFMECAAFGLFLLFAVHDKKANSSVIALSIMVLFGVVMHWYAPYLLTLQTPETRPYVLFIWYVGFVAIDALGIWILYRVHDAFTIRYSVPAKILMIAYFVLAMANLIRYGERLLLGMGSVYLKPLYQAFIPAINIGMATTVLGFALIIALSRWRTGKGKKGVAWVL